MQVDVSFPSATVRAAGMCFIKQQLGHQPAITTPVVTAQAAEV